MEGTASRPDRTLMIVALAVVALVVLAVVAVLARGEPELLDESTPEGVVQRYVAAVIEGDEPRAATYLTDRALENCEQYRGSLEEDIRVTLQSTRVFDDSADVTVTITTSHGADLLGPSEYRSQEIFDLREVDGDWKIDTVPWQLSTVCQEVGS